MTALLLYILIISILIWSIKYSNYFGNSKTYKKWLFIAFTIKIVATIGMWYIYTYYYTDHAVNDIYKYFNDGKIIHSLLKNNPLDFLKLISGQEISTPSSISKINELKYWVKINNYGIYNDNQTIILLNSLLLFLSKGNIIVQSLYLSTTSFFITILLFNSLTIYFENKKKYLFVILFFTPSLILWSSGLFKETIIWMTLSLLIINMINLMTKVNSFRYLIQMPILIFFLLISKAYYAVFILPTICCIVINIFIKKINIKLIFRSVYLTLFSLFIYWALFHNPITYNYEGKNRKEQIEEYKKVTSLSYERNVLGNDFNILEMLRFKQVDYRYEARVKKAKSTIKIKELDGNLINLFECLPLGLINAITRPSLFDINSPLILLPAVENTFILLLFFLAFKFKNQVTNDQRAIDLTLRYFTISMLIFLGILVPVIGNLVRYRAPILPFILILLLFRININQFTEYLRKITQMKQS